MRILKQITNKIYRDNIACLTCVGVCVVFILEEKKNHFSISLYLKMESLLLMASFLILIIIQYEYVMYYNIVDK